MANHLEQIEEQLRSLIAQGDAGALVAWVKERVLESYKNGLSARRRGEAGAGGRRGLGRSFGGARSGFSRKGAGEIPNEHGH